jgi:hypothetical protein
VSLPLAVAAGRRRARGVPPRGQTRRGLLQREKVAAAAAGKEMDWEEEEEEEEEDRTALMMAGMRVGATKQTQSAAGARA